MYKSGKVKSEYLMANFIAVLILLISMLSLCSCGVDDIDISAYGEETITLTGVVDKDLSLSVADLKAMECVTEKTKSTSDKIGEVRATGPTLNTVLAQYGSTQSDFNSIRIYAKDGYDIKLSKDFIDDNEIILAFGIDGSPLDEENAPVRIIIPESDSAYWIRMVSKIEFNAGK